MKKLITFFLNLVMESEAEQQAGAIQYGHSENRKAYHNGKRSRFLKTRYGDIVLDKPDFREKPFQTVVFDRYNRVERSLENAIVESYIQGVSTREQENGKSLLKNHTLPQVDEIIAVRWS
jgi:putative transposase